MARYGNVNAIHSFSFITKIILSMYVRIYISEICKIIETVLNPYDPENLASQIAVQRIILQRRAGIKTAVRKGNFIQNSGDQCRRWRLVKLRNYRAIWRTSTPVANLR